MSTILITGASSGIGRACAELFAEKSWRLIILARRGELLSSLSKALQARHGVEVSTVTLDVRDRAAVESWARDSREQLAGVDVLVNSAGLARGMSPLPEGDVDDWEEMIDTNVKGLLHVTRAVVPHLVERGSGHVVNIGSVAGRWVYPNGAVYCASKHAVRAINEGLRIDLNGKGVRVTTVDPGMVATEFSLVRFHGDAEKAASVYAGMEPLKPEDVADTIGWIVERPAHVNVAELVLLPTDQASPTLVHRHEPA